MQNRDLEDAHKLAAALREHYLEVRVLDDGTVAALVDLFSTRAICLGCNDWGYDARFCFKDRELARQRFHELKTADDEPQGWIARRPEPPGFYDPPKKARS